VACLVLAWAGSSAGAGSRARADAWSGVGLVNPSQPGGQPPTLHPVDPLNEDVSPLSRSLRVMQPDLRVPIGFERVYKVEGTPRLYGHAPAGEGLMARVSGAVIAVFPRSEYSSQSGRPVIPAGTVFLLGDASEVLVSRPGKGRELSTIPGRVSNATERRVGTRVDFGAVYEPPGEYRFRPERVDGESRSMWTDEGERRARVAARLDELARAAIEPRRATQSNAGE